MFSAALRVTGQCEQTSMVRKASALAYVSAPARPDSGPGSLRRFLRGPFGRVADLITRMSLSVRAKILLSLCIIILIMGITPGMLVVQVLNDSRRYDAIIANMTIANSISGRIKPDIDTEMWRIVASTQYQQMRAGFYTLGGSLLCSALRPLAGS